jgi:hypothetical protein
MPVTIELRLDKYRIVEAESGKIAKNESGNAIDGGGHATKSKAMAQMVAINRSKNNPVKVESETPAKKGKKK